MTYCPWQLMASLYVLKSHWCLTCMTNSESNSAIDPVNAGLVTPLPGNIWIKELNQNWLVNANQVHLDKGVGSMWYPESTLWGSSAVAILPPPSPQSLLKPTYTVEEYLYCYSDHQALIWLGTKLTLFAPGGTNMPPPNPNQTLNK